MRRLSAVIGNTTCRIALMQDTACEREDVFTHAECLKGGVLAERLGPLAGGAEEAVLCSVVPELNAAVTDALRSATGGTVREIRYDGLRAMELRYGTPHTLGMDRVCGALAARELYGAPVLAVDCGTATTVNAVDPGGAFVGGWIVPGIATALHALHTRTSQLPAVHARQEEAVRPPAGRAQEAERVQDAGASGLSAPSTADAVPLIGASTEESMRAGVVQQTRLAVAELARLLGREWSAQVRIVLTGGNAAQIISAANASKTDTEKKARYSLSGNDEPYVQQWQHDQHLVHRGAILYLLLA
jgi:pantothenate kinase type III